MKEPFAVILLPAVLAGAAGLAGCSDSTAASASADDRVEHGRYIVHQVAGCVDCHSPRQPNGAFIPDKHLTGSPLAFAPTVPMPWADFAPPVAGIPAGYTEASLKHFLMTGERPGGLPAPRPPMPPYRLNEKDADAVVAYLKTLMPSS